MGGLFILCLAPMSLPHYWRMAIGAFLPRIWSISSEKGSSSIGTVHGPVEYGLSRKQRGDLAELKVACDVVQGGAGVAIPFGEDADFDLIAYGDRALARIQVKHGRSRDGVLVVRCRSYSLTNGRVRSEKRYTAQTIDWIAVWDCTTDRCFYIPAAELGSGRSTLHLRLVPTRNGQLAGTRDAADYAELKVP